MQKLETESTKNDAIHHIDAPISAMRRATNSHIHGLSGTPIDVIARRGAFKWLPVICKTDCSTGSWFFVWGSILTVLIPIFPIIALYQGWWPHPGYIPQTENTAAYALLALCGYFYTLGSIALERAFQSPIPPPVFTWKHFQTDELFGYWMFVLGTLPTIPCLALYANYNRNSGTFVLALLICIIVEILMVIFTLLCYPSEKGEAEHVSRSSI